MNNEIIITNEFEIKIILKLLSLSLELLTTQIVEVSFELQRSARATIL